MVKREMKFTARFLPVILALVSGMPAVAAVPTTVGNNLTAYNGSAAAMNNNTWNSMMNSRSGTGNAPTVDFGNCNAVIMRCAQPKCASGGCTSLDVARPIVSGCVQSNANCAQYGNDLVEYISAQLVANSTAKANAAAAAAQTAAANAAAQQNAQQLQAMQQQMQQMQSEMASQNAQTVAQLQSALEQQKELTAQAVASATAAAQTAAESTSTTAAASSGVSADVLAREQIAGQVLSKIENAQTALKTLKATMNDTFEYAGCDASGNNCAGPKRVKAFKQRAMNFFEPYNNVLDELYDALIMAQSVGVDISDIYMMLNGTCNAWAQYMCQAGQTMHYTTEDCKDGKSTASGAKCTVGSVKPMSDGGCQLVKMLTDNDEVQRNWLYPEKGDEKSGVSIQVGCASEALDNSALFRSRKKQASIDIDTLQRIIEQDAPTTGVSRLSKNKQSTPQKYCAVDEESLADLQKVASLKTLPSKVCVTDTYLDTKCENSGCGVNIIQAESAMNKAASSVASGTDTSGGIKFMDCSKAINQGTPECKCRSTGGTWYGLSCSCSVGTKWDDALGCTIPGLQTPTLNVSGLDTSMQSLKTIVKK